MGLVYSNLLATVKTLASSVEGMTLYQLTTYSNQGGTTKMATAIMCATGGVIGWVIMSYIDLVADRVFGTEK